LKAKYTKFEFGWALSKTLLGELRAVPRPFSWSKGNLLLREWKRREWKGVTSNQRL